MRGWNKQRQNKRKRNLREVSVHTKAAKQLAGFGDIEKGLGLDKQGVTDPCCLVPENLL